MAGKTYLSPQYLLYLFVGLVVIYYVLNYILNIKIEHFSIDTAKAQDACVEISGKAAEALKQPEAPTGINAIMNNVTSWMNPNNYRAGENVSLNINNQSFNTDLSKEELTDIVNSCSNTAATAQLNIISTPATCEYCNKFGCNIQNITQTNKANFEQTCKIEAVINKLLTKSNNTDSQALASVLQQAQGLLSGSNRTAGVNCNAVSTDMSAKEYLTQITSCANSISANQTNTLSQCGNATNVVQENVNKQIQDCIISSTQKAEENIASTTKTKVESTVEQKSVGLDFMASVASGGVSVIFFSLAASVAIFMLSQGGGAGAPPPRFPQYMPLPGSFPR